MIDSYGRRITYLRLSVTERCNLRCRYCMPEEGICQKDCSEMLTEDEMIAAVQAAASLGITKLRITGGEPLVKKNIVSICRRACAVPGIQDVAVTTNGLALPALAKPLRQAGVNRVNISLDTLNRQRFCQITGSDSFPAVMQAIKTGCALGLPLKINTVLLPETKEEDIEKFLCLIKELPLALRFITRMDIGKNMDAPLKEDGRFSTFAQVAAFCEKKGLSLIPDSSRKGNGPASYFHIPGFAGCLGEIDAMHKKFCSSCNRIRLTADGNLKPCLYYSDSYPLKELLRKGCDDESLRARIWQAAYEKPSCHHFEKPVKGDAREKHFMNQIGG